MKRSIGILLALFMLITCIPVADAADISLPTEQVIYYADGSYAIITTEELPCFGIDGILSSQASSKSGSKSYTYYENGGTAVWRATLTASFSYNGSSASCTAANCTVSIFDSAWYVISKSASRSGNTAAASVTMGKSQLGVTTKTASCSLSLSCDANGNLS